MANLLSGLSEKIANDEDLARFLTQSSHFNALIVKPSAFMPSTKSRETSVSRHGHEPIERLWKIGREAAVERNLYGAAIFKAGAVRNAGLEVFAAEPPERHAAIRKWPWVEDDPDEQRAQQKELALILASAAGAPFLI